MFSSNFQILLIYLIWWCDLESENIVLRSLWILHSRNGLKFYLLMWELKNPDSGLEPAVSTTEHVILPRGNTLCHSRPSLGVSGRPSALSPYLAHPWALLTCTKYPQHKLYLPLHGLASSLPQVQPALVDSCLESVGAAWLKLQRPLPSPAFGQSCSFSLPVQLCPAWPPCPTPQLDWQVSSPVGLDSSSAHSTKAPTGTSFTFSVPSPAFSPFSRWAKSWASHYNACLPVWDRKLPPCNIKGNDLRGRLSTSIKEGCWPQLPKHFETYYDLSLCFPSFSFPPTPRHARDTVMRKTRSFYPRELLIWLRRKTVYSQTRQPEIPWLIHLSLLAVAPVLKQKALCPRNASVLGKLR